jgi:hypothetical protein
MVVRIFGCLCKYSSGGGPPHTLIFLAVGSNPPRPPPPPAACTDSPNSGLAAAPPSLPPSTTTHHRGQTLTCWTPVPPPLPNGTLQEPGPITAANTNLSDSCATSTSQWGYPHSHQVPGTTGTRNGNLVRGTLSDKKHGTKGVYRVGTFDRDAECEPGALGTIVRNSKLPRTQEA